MAGSTAIEEKLDALMDAVCVQAILMEESRRSGFIAPKACRERPHIVFVSSETFTGNVQVAGDADGKCNRLAENAGLPGIYKAWITGERSPDSNPPAFRFARAFGPYLLVDGTLIANDWDDLTDGTLAAPIDLNEKGESTSVEVWTNVSVDGTRLNVTIETTCNNFNPPIGESELFTGIFGVSTETGPAWTNSGVDTCDQMKALYCFGQ